MLRAALPFHRQKFEPAAPAAPVDGRRPDDFLTANTDGPKAIIVGGVVFGSAPSAQRRSEYLAARHMLQPLQHKRRQQPQLVFGIFVVVVVVVAAY